MTNTPHSTEHDVAIIGGSFAGMAAALQLARARRSIVIFDTGQPRNRTAEESRGFLTHDGSSPEHIINVAREQLNAYPTITWRKELVDGVSGSLDDFTVQDESGTETHARLVILATGVIDHLPQIEGLQERWGTVAFNCPYCHGYELNEGRIGVIATGDASFDQAMMLPEWGEVTLFLNDALQLDAVQTRALEIKNVKIESSPIQHIIGQATIELADGKSLEVDGIAISNSTSISDLPSKLGCEIDGEEGAELVKVDDMQATSVEGVFACGDIARPLHSITFAVASGSMAGTAAHKQLLHTD